ncbi:hypothetical protein F5146DRAFT_663211 [Armillaria mellea]|nr:hypothetical protein F5146DRAFT_663211 [Armillaria mellea]
MSTSLTLYDISSTLPSKAWSPNIWKARPVFSPAYSTYRLLLHLDTCSTTKAFHTTLNGLSTPTSKACTRSSAPKPVPPRMTASRPTTRALFSTMPSTGALVSDSAAIAQYLDRTYPETPSVIPKGTDALHHAFTEASESHFRVPALWRLTLAKANSIMNPVSQEYNRAREGSQILEDPVPTGEERQREWAKVKDAFGKVDRWYGKGDRYVMGDVLSFADFTVSAWVMWFRTLFGEDSEEWRDVSTWYGGRWGALAKDMEKYEMVL